MNQNDEYKKLFSSLETPEPPADLAERVLLRIARRERRIIGIKIAASSAALAVSVGVSVVGGMDFATGVAHSGFLAIGGLLFTDLSTVIANFPDFALSLIEAFPVFAAAALLGGIMFAIWSFAALVDEASLLHTNHEQSFGI